MSSRGTPLLPLAALALACGREELLHDLAEAQANQVVVALEEKGIAAQKRRDEGDGSTWHVEVAPRDRTSAHHLLAELELPRAPQSGFGEVFGKGSTLPTASEERALYLLALSGEVARSIEAIEGVLRARVHFALPPVDPFRLEPPRPVHASVLIKVTPGARGRLEATTHGIRSLVAGAAPGLEEKDVAVVMVEGAPPLPPAQRANGAHHLLLALAATALITSGAAALVATGRRNLRALFHRLLGRPVHDERTQLHP